MKYLQRIFAILVVAMTTHIPSLAQAAEVELSWDRPQASSAFIGFKIHWGTQRGRYTQQRDVPKNRTTVTIENLQPGATYFFAATTVNQAGDESEFSNEVTVTVPADSDGISDRDEREIYGTHPKRADSDGDDINDGDEIAFWGDAWRDDADGDGLINLLDRDADNDGVADAAEIAANENPAEAPPPQVKPLELEFRPIATAWASEDNEPHTAAQTFDGELGTHWEAEDDGQWIAYDLGAAVSIAEVAIAWYQGDRHATAFTLEASVDGTVWQEAFSGDSSGNTRDLESYTFNVLPARYVRVVGYGNDIDRWNRIAEIEIYGPPSQMPLAIQAVQASHENRSNPAANTLDGNLNTHWSAKGDGQWLMYDAGAMAIISEVAIAWSQGDRRAYSFVLEVSSDGKTWREVLSGDSSGATRQLESYVFPAEAARYVLIVGYGNITNLWNSVAETEIRGHVLDKAGIDVR